MSSPSYDRAPSPRLRRLLAPDGFLAPLLAERELDSIVLEVHLGREDEVLIYCGLARLVKSGLGTCGKVWVKSHQIYAEQTCARRLIRLDRAKKVDQGEYLCDEWDVGDPDFAGALDVFLGDVHVPPGQKREGAIQARWAQAMEPWIVFDKEAALAYPSKKERARQLSEAFDPSVNEAHSQLCVLARSRRSLPNRRDHWQMPPKSKTRLELDHLAVDSAGNLVLLEIKEASRSASPPLYYAPFQLLQNVWEWHRALDTVRSSVQELLDARVELGLSPGGVPPISGGIRAVVGFGDDEWMSEEVEQRYLQVLSIANQFLPDGVDPIETWCLEHEKPVRMFQSSTVASPPSAV